MGVKISANKEKKTHLSKILWEFTFWLPADLRWMLVEKA